MVRYSEISRRLITDRVVVDGVAVAVQFLREFHVYTLHASACPSLQISPSVFSSVWFSYSSLHELALTASF